MLPSTGLPALPPSAHPAIGFSSHLETLSALFAGSIFEKILTKKVSVGGLIWGRERSGDCMEETVTAAKLFQSPEIGQTSYSQFGSLFFETRNKTMNKLKGQSSHLLKIKMADFLKLTNMYKIKLSGKVIYKIQNFYPNKH